MPEHHSFEVEQEQPKNSRLLLYGVVVAIVFFGSAIVLTNLFYQTSEALVYRRVLSQPSPQLLELRQKEEQQLSSYGWVGKEKKEVHIPIDRAMHLMGEESPK